MTAQDLIKEKAAFTNKCLQYVKDYVKEYGEDGVLKLGSNSGCYMYIVNSDFCGDVMRPEITALAVIDGMLAFYDEDVDDVSPKELLDDMAGWTYEDNDYLLLLQTLYDILWQID